MQVFIIEPFDHNRKQTIVNVSSNIFILKMRDLQVFQIFIFVVGSLILSLSNLHHQCHFLSHRQTFSRNDSAPTPTPTAKTPLKIFKRVQLLNTIPLYNLSFLSLSSPCHSHLKVYYLFLALFSFTFPFETYLYLSEQFLLKIICLSLFCNSL